MAKKNALIIFIRNPELSKVKTRIAATHGKELALQIYQSLLDITLACTQSLKVDKYLYYSESIIQDKWDDSVYFKRVQSGGDLGERMKNALAEILEEYDHALIIGSDCPYLTPSIITNAFAELEKKSVVIGPAFDGGYYLLGMSQLLPDLFENMPWSTDQLTTETLKKLEKKHLLYSILPELHDVDEYFDWVNYINQTSLPGEP